MTFAELQTEVAEKASRNDSTQSTTGIKNAINGALFTIGRAAYWRALRRKSYFNTVTSYTTGSGNATYTNGSTSVSVTGATFLTDGVRVGRLVKLGGNQKIYTIRTITSETTFTIDRDFDGTTASGDGTYEILPQEEYTLPLQVTHRCFLWHEDYGYPYQMEYITDQSFWSYNIDRNNESTPEVYRMWSDGMFIDQLKNTSTVNVVSTSAVDTSQTITIYGTVSGYPDQESISLNGTTTSSGTKSFDSIDRVSRSASTAGRITVTGDSGYTTVAVIPAGNGTDQIIYSKVQLWPLPDDVFPINVYYYKDVYKLVNDSDIHELGAQFDRAIIYLAASDIKFEEGQQEGSNFYQMYMNELKELKKTNVDKIDFVNVLRSGARGRSTPKGAPFLSYRQIGTGNYGPPA